MALPEVGLKLVAEQQAAFLQAINQAAEVTKALTKALELNSAALNTTSEKTKEAAKSSDVFVASANRITNALKDVNMFTIAAGTAIGNFATSAIASATTAVGNLVGGFKQYTQESILISAQTLKMSEVLYNLGNTAGFTRKEIDASVEGVKKANIQTDAAQKLVSNFFRMGMDIKQAAPLANVAKDLAQLTDRQDLQNSSAMLEQLLYGIQTTNTEVLRGAGILLNMQDVQKKYATGTSAAARQQAVFNAVIAEGAKSAGAYDAAMNSASKILSSLERVLYETKNAVGAPFQEMYLQWAKVQDSFFKGVLAMVQAGGILEPALNAIGQIMAAIAGNVGKMTKAFEGFFQSTQKGTVGEFLTGLETNITKVGSKIPDLDDGLQGLMATARTINAAFQELKDTFVAAGAAISGAFNYIFKAISEAINPSIEKAKGWGTGIVQNLADGISEATAYVVAALQVLGDIIAYFLSPGSPPRLLPELTSWGTKAATEFMGGWARADMSGLQEMSGNIQGILDIFVSQGKMKGTEKIPMLWSLRAQLAGIITELNATGKVADSTWTQIATTAGVAGEAVSAFLKLNVEQYQLNKLLEAQQKQMGKNQEEQNALMYKISIGRGTGEDARRLMALQGQATELKAAMTTEIDRKEVVDEQLSAQQSLIATRKEENSLLSQQSQLMAGLGQQQSDLADKMDAAARSGGASASALEEGSKSIKETLSGVAGLSASQSKIFDNIALRTKEIKDSWGGSAGIIAEISKIKNEGLMDWLFKPQVSKRPEDKDAGTAGSVAPPTSRMQDFAGPLLKRLDEAKTLLIEKAIEIGSKLATSIVETLATGLVKSYNEKHPDAKLSFDISKGLADNWPVISKVLYGWADDFWAWLIGPGGVVSTAVENIDKFIKSLTVALSSDKTHGDIQTAGTNVGITMTDAFSLNIANIERIAGIIKQLVGLIFDAIKLSAAAIQDIGVFIGEGVFNGLVKGFTEKAPSWMVALSGFKKEVSTNNFGDTGHTQGVLLGQGLASGIDGSIPGANASMLNMTSQLIKVSNDTLQSKSPSKVFQEIGKNMILGMVLGADPQIAIMQKNVSDMLQYLLTTTQEQGKIIWDWWTLMWTDMIAKITGMITAMEIDLVAAFQSLVKFLNDEAGPAFDNFKVKVLDPLAESVKSLSEGMGFLIGMIEEAIEKMKKLTGAVNDSPIIGKSPSPLENSVRGIGDAVNDLAAVKLPKLVSNLEVKPSPTLLRTLSSSVRPPMGAGQMMGGSSVSNTRTNQYNLNLTTTPQVASSAVQTFGLLRTLTGVTP